MREGYNIKRIFSIVIAFLMCMVFVPAINIQATGEQEITEIRINSDTKSVNVGFLEAFTITTTTEHISIDDYGNNTGWVWYNGYIWYGFSDEKPVAYNNGTRYGMSLCVHVDEGYKLSSTAKIYYNGVECTSLLNNIREFDWGGYVSIDLGQAVGESGFCGPMAEWCFNKEKGSLYISGTGAMDEMAIGDETKPVPWANFMKDIKYVDIEEGITNIPDTAFYGADKLNIVNLPKGLDKIGSKAFANCSSLKKLMVPATVKDIALDAFSGIDTVFYEGTAVDSQGKNWGAKNFVKSYMKAGEGIIATFDKGVLNIMGEGDFYKDEYSFGEQPWAAYGNNIHEVNITGNIEKIPKYAFNNFESIKKVNIDANVKIIGESAFSGCNSLEELKLNAGLEEIGRMAFYYNDIFTLDIPSTVKSIGEGALFGTTNINYTGKAVAPYKDNWGASNLNGYIEKGIIYSDKSKKEIVGSDKRVAAFTIPKTVETIGAGAFWNNTNIKSIVIPKGVQFIQSNAFAGCSDLAKVDIPSTVTLIGNSAFANTNLVDVYVPCSVTELGYEAFLGAKIVYYSGIGINDSCGAGEIKPNKNADAHVYTRYYHLGNGKHKVVCEYCDFVCAYRAKEDCSGKETIINKGSFSENGSKDVICEYCGSMVSKYIYAIKTVKLSSTKFTYDGKVKKPTVTVKDAEGNKIAATNYTVKYAKGRKKVGTYTVKITFKGDYTGSKKLTFTINPPKTSVSSIKASRKGFTLKWKKKTKEVTGYEIQYSTSKKFKSGNKTAVVKKAKTVSKSVRKLKAKKKYYVRVRTYKTVGKTKYYSGWSKVKIVKTK